MEPIRSCAACRARRPKGQLLRFVRNSSGGVELDPKGSSPGRGAYTCRDLACIERALRRGGLARTLRVTIMAAEAVRLEAMGYGSCLEYR
ncbi:MAG: YlxR family protein [Actinomycetota bacterium]